MLDELASVVLGEGSSPADRIRLMGQYLLLTYNSPSEMNGELLAGEAAVRFNRLRLPERANQFLETYKMLNGELDGVVAILVLLSRRVPDAVLARPVARYRPPLIDMPVSTKITLEYEESAPSVDDGCVNSSHDDPSPTRLPSGLPSPDYLQLLLNPRRRSGKLYAEASWSAVAQSVGNVFAGSPSFLFPNKHVGGRHPMDVYITGWGVPRSKTFLDRFSWMADELNELERQLEAQRDGNDVARALAVQALKHLQQFRNEWMYSFRARPHPSDACLRHSLEEVYKEGERLVVLLQLAIHLRDASASQVLDSLECCIHSIGLSDDKHGQRLAEFTKHIVQVFLRDAGLLMCNGEVSSMQLVRSRKTVDVKKLHTAVGGRAEGEEWRGDFSLFVPSGDVLSPDISASMLAQAKLAIMLKRMGKWTTTSLEDKGRVDHIDRHTTPAEIGRVFHELIENVRESPYRAEFVRCQLLEVANSLEIVRKVFLLGDGQLVAQLRESGNRERLQGIRNAIRSYSRKHLISVDYRGRLGRETSARLHLCVHGALAIIVSASSVRIYTSAYKLLTKLDELVAQLTQLDIESVPLLPSHWIRRGQFIRQEMLQWTTALLDFFLVQVHEVIFAELQNALCSAPSFDAAFSLHRRTMRALARRLLMDNDSSAISCAMHTSLEAIQLFLAVIRRGNPQSSEYLSFLDGAMLFVQGLSLEACEPWQSDLLDRIDSRAFYRAGVNI